MRREKYYRDEIERKLRELGNDPAVTNFMSKYANSITKALYLANLAQYLRWLRTKGICLTPSEIITDNLVSQFKSDPTDVISKAKHTNLLNEYVNTTMFGKEYSESARRLASASVRMFYGRNNSPLWGDYAVAETPANQLPTRPGALFAEDIRKVLLAMDIRCRAPLVVAWQSGIEIGRVLLLEGKIPTSTGTPVKIDFVGRKTHRLPYHTYVGMDSIEAIRMLGEKKYVTYDIIRSNFRDTAIRLGKQGLLRNPNAASWSPHKLRHSFRTEGLHAGVKSEIMEYFSGRTEGIKWIYTHTDEIHPEDLLVAYKKMEPVVSLHPDRTVAAEEFSSREREFTSEIARLHQLYAELKKELKDVRSMRPFPS